MDNEQTWKPHQEPYGLGGWLIVLGIRLILILLFALPNLSSLYADWQEVRVLPSAELPSPVFKPVFFSVLAGAVLLSLAWCYAIFAFFRKKKIFPFVFTVMSVADIVFGFTAVYLFGVISGQNLFDSETLPPLFGAIVAACIWIPYVKISKRVENTFVEQGWL